MAYTKYSLTPANNTAAPPDGAPEGMLPSAVNDTMRDMMSQIRDVGDGVRDGTYTMTAPKITGGTITGVTLTGNTLTNPVITGATLTTSAFNGTVGATTASTGAFTTLSTSSTTTLSGLTASTALALDASKNVVSVTNTGSGNNVLATSPTLVTPALGTPSSATLTNATGLPLTTGVTGTLPVANGGTGVTTSTGTGNNVLSASPTLTGTIAGASLSLSSLTSGRVTYAGASGLLSDSANLTFSGSNLGVNGTTTIGNQLSSGTSGSFSITGVGGAVYLQTGQNTSSASAAPLVFTNSGAANEWMRITSAGNVGIGTSSPNTLFSVAHVASAGTSIGIQHSSNNAQLLRMGWNDSSDYTFINTSNGTRPLVLQNTGGNVGIGTSSPSYTLDVTGQIRASSGASASALIATSTSSGGTALNIQNSGTVNALIGGWLSCIGSGNATDVAIAAYQGALGFATNGANIRMTLDANGSLALGGTTVASSNGGMTITCTSSGSSSAPLTLRNAGTANGSGVYLIYRGVTNTGAENDYGYFNMVADDTTAKTSSMRFSTANGSSPVERMRIDSSGNVGIGTTSPSDTLSVIKSTMTNQIVMGLNTTDTTYGSISFSGSNSGANRIGLTGGGGSDKALYLDSPTGGAFYFRINAVNRQEISSSGILTMSAYGAGAATFASNGTISSVSDETWKTKDGVPTNTDAMLQKLEPGYWFYNEEKAPIFGQDRQLGFYAQNVHEAIGEEAAPTPEEGKPWGYYDRSVLAVVVMSLKNALNTIEELKQRIETLENK